MTAVRLAVSVLGVLGVVVTALSAVSTVVVPRAVPVRLTLVVFRVMRGAFDLRTRWLADADRADHALAKYAPFSLLGLVVTWLALLLVCFTAVFWGLGDRPSLGTSFERSGSALTTLGVADVEGTAQHAMSFLEAGLGLFVLALMISYLPAMYGAFQRREALVTLADIQAGSPPSGVDLLRRFHRIRGLDALEDQVWGPWLRGFAELEESHTSLAALAYFRSPLPGRSWVTAAGAVLDAAALLDSTVDVPRQPAGNVCLRAGYLSLQRIAGSFGLPHDATPQQGDPISVERAEWEEARLALVEAGIPVRSDVEASWLDFAGWRVNYDTVLIGLAGMVGAPPAPWSSDRAGKRHTPPLRLRRRVAS